MSSTNRGAERIESDLYPTPLESFTPLLPYLPREGQIWEPAWGDARLVRCMLEHDIDAWGSDLNDAEEPQDFLRDPARRYCILTNPPFSLAFDFVQHAVRQAEHVFLLLRLNFLASKGRRPWFKLNEPSCLFILSERPEFVRSVVCSKKCGYKKLFPIESAVPDKCPDCGSKVKTASSDSCDYCWMYWGNLWKGIVHL